MIDYIAYLVAGIGTAACLYGIFMASKLVYECKTERHMGFDEVVNRLNKVQMRAAVHWPVVWISRREAEALMIASAFLETYKEMEEIWGEKA